MLSETSPEPASRLFSATILASAAGIFFGIYFLFIDPEMAFRIATALMVGVVGILSFLRHSVFYQSDQSRMGWAQENPQFQIEVGLANLSMGGAALAASLLGWGSQACGITLLIYGLYISCTSLLHIREALHLTEKKEQSVARIANSAIFALALIAFAVIAFHGA
jgi:uncharacterized membrane protein YfcA